MPVIGPGDGKTFDLAGYRPAFKVLSTDSDGHLSMEEETVPPGTLPFLHRHLKQTEIFYVIEGELEFTIGAEIATVPAGSTVIVPIGLPHAYANVSEVPARMLGMWTPGGFERILEESEADTASRGAFDWNVFLAIYRRHGNEAL